MDKNIIMSLGEVYLLSELIRIEINQLQRNQFPLIESIFECRRKVLFASFGLKRRFFGGWHGKSFTNKENIILAGKDALSNYYRLRNEHIKIKTLNDIHHRIINYTVLTKEEQEEDLNEKLKSFWLEIIEILASFGHKLTQEDCESRLNRIYQMWEINENMLKKQFEDRTHYNDEA